VSIAKQDFVVFDLGSQVPKGASFVLLSSRQARLMAYGEDDRGPREEDFVSPTEDYVASLRQILDKLTRKDNFSLIISLPLHHLIWKSKKVAYRRKPSIEPLNPQELKNLFFYIQSRVIERMRRNMSDLFFVAGALSGFKLDGREVAWGAKGRDLELSFLYAFMPRYLVDFTKAAFPTVSGDRISFFVFPLGIRGKGKKLLVVDSGAAKISFTEIISDLVSRLELLPLGGVDFTYALARKGESLEKAESRKKEGAWKETGDLNELVESALSLIEGYDEGTSALLSGRSWPLFLEETVRKKLSGDVFWERELNEELGFFPELPLAISAAMRYSLFLEEDTPQRLFQRIASITAH